MPRRRRSDKTTSHRVPPKPASWNCPRGQCRFCGDPIIENGEVNRRKHWHGECAKTWVVMNNPQKAREHVLRRDRYTCQDCGHHDRHGAFETDHRRPLFEANGDLSFWHADNLTLLCLECHRRKTNVDMERWREAQRAREDAYD